MSIFSTFNVTTWRSHSLNLLRPLFRSRQKTFYQSKKNGNKGRGTRANPVKCLFTDHCTNRAIFKYQKLILECFGFPYLCSVIQKTRAILSTKQMQKYKHRVNSVVPCLKQFACFHFEFALADDRVNLRSDWSLGLLWFGFTTFN